MIPTVGAAEDAAREPMDPFTALTPMTAANAVPTTTVATPT